MKFRNVPIGELCEHPKNKEYFRDISDISPEFWETFKENINRLGFIEPLIVNENTMEVISGNQRLKAGLELEMATVPCIMVSPEKDGDEVRMMISSNVMRRELDPFTLFSYIGMMRKDAEGQGDNQGDLSSFEEESSVKAIKAQVKKSGEFVSAADIWATLTEEQQKEIKQWFYAPQDGGKEPTQKELIQQIRDLKEAQLIADKTKKELQEAIADRKEEIAKLRKQMNEDGENRAEAIRSLKKEVSLLKEAASEESKRDRDLKKLASSAEDALAALNKAAVRVSELIASIKAIDPNLKFKGFPKATLVLAVKDILANLQLLRKNIEG